MMNDTPIELQLAEEVSRYYADPLGFVLFAYEWGKGDLEGHDGPDLWQRRILTRIGVEVTARGFDGVMPVEPIQFATASGHGIGKSALCAWLTDWIMSTRPHSKGVITANTGDQLRTKTMSELAKWTKRCITGHWFDPNTMSMTHKAYPETWRVDAQTCREENAEAFAGLHAAESTPWYLFDEASAIPEKIWEVAEGGKTDGEPMHFVFGNPTRNSGTFYECFGRQRHRWITEQIDSRTAKMPNKTQIQKWIDDYGEDSDFVRVRVRGVFPRAGDAQFIPSDSVLAAMKRGPGRYLGTDPLICGIDVSRGGGDDSMIQFRRGRDAKSEKVYRIPAEKSRDSMKLISLITTVLDRHIPDVTFIDETGLGGPIADRLNQLGYHVIGVNFGSRADDDKKYANKSAEMWWRMREWLMKEGAVRDNAQLEAELTTREYYHNKRDQLVMESKDDMKKRGLGSPDWADALALTFAYAVPPRATERGMLDAGLGSRQNFSSLNMNPLDALDRRN